MRNDRRLPTEQADAAIRRLFADAFRRFGGIGDVAGLLHCEKRETDIRSMRRALHEDEGRGEATVSHLGIERRRGCMVLPRPHMADVVRSAAAFARAQRRRAAIDAVCDERDPAWSMTAHPLVRAAMVHAGVDPMPVRIDHDEDGTTSSSLDQVMTDRRAVLKISAGRVWSMVIRDVAPGATPTFEVGELRDRRVATLGLPTVSLPETLRHVLPGMRLADVVDHAIVDMVPDLVVLDGGPRWTKDKNGNHVEKGYALRVAGRPVAFAPPPPDADTSWMRLPALHRNDVEV